MKYTSTERQARHDALNKLYDRFLEMQDREDDQNINGLPVEGLIDQVIISLEILDLDEALAQIDKCRAERTISRDIHEMTARAIRFQRQSLIDQLTAIISERQAIISMRIG